MSDGANAIAVDASGNAFITGSTYSSDFPVVFSGGSLFVGIAGNRDAFVTKIDSSGAIAASRYLPAANTTGSGVAMDSNGAPYITGSTGSATFPTTAGSFMTTKPSAGTSNSGFVAKLDTSLNITYATYLGGGGTDNPAAIAVDSNMRAFITGSTTSSNFPTSNGAFQTTFGGNTDAFVTELNAQGSALVYSTYLGGSNLDQANAIALDGSGIASVTGVSQSTNFPTNSGAFLTSKPISSQNSNVFVTKINSGGGTLGYSTFLGGSSYNNDTSAGITVNSSGDAFVLGSTYATDFPTTPGALLTQLPPNNYYGQILFLTELNATGSSIIYSTYFGSPRRQTGVRLRKTQMAESTSQV
jgi:hypothetical protein